MDLSKNWMITKPRKPARESIEEVKILEWILKHDIHKWIVAKEKGTLGYEHWQIRLQCGLSFEEMKAHWGEDSHIEEASDTWEYERKDGNFLSSTDTLGALQQRFAELREWQQNLLEKVKSAGDRTIDVCYDPSGNHGKSFLIGHLWETGQAHCVQGQNNAKGIVQDCASEFIAHGWRDIVVIDIPWSWKWTTDLYVAIERIKDGLIKDTRYGSRTINIHGVKVLVMCNTKPNEKRLASDRWRLTTLSEEGRALST